MASPACVFHGCSCTTMGEGRCLPKKAEFLHLRAMTNSRATPPTKHLRNRKKLFLLLTDLSTKWKKMPTSLAAELASVSPPSDRAVYNSLISEVAWRHPPELLSQERSIRCPTPGLAMLQGGSDTGATFHLLQILNLQKSKLEQNSHLGLI